MAKKNTIQLIVSPGTATKGPEDVFKKLKSLDKGLEIREFINVHETKKNTKAKGPIPPKQFIVKTSFDEREISPWEVAHVANQTIPSTQSFVEPDLENEFVVDRKIKSHKNFNQGDDDINFDNDWFPKENKVWHLTDEFSQLISARKQVENLPGTITIAHFDTGYDPDHFILPKNLNKKLARNFVEGENIKDATDPHSEGFLKMPGHGTGTIGILAGNVFKTKDGKFNDELGGASFAEIIPFRIAKTVVLLRTSAFAQALNHITNLTTSGEKIFHVLTMSMGGSASQAWADAVNAAYEAGITMVTAAGNHFNGLPTDHLIYPARFNRVIAACGVTNDYKPYRTKKLGEMQGCAGPKKFMNTAMSAFTPNTPWAKWGKNSISFAGAGTSSATPQIASAAAIYYKENKAALDSLLPWQRVEAIRHALFKTAKQHGKKSFENFGMGIIKAHDALKIPVDVTKLKMSRKDDVGFFPELTVIFKAKKTPVNKNEGKMFNVEILQLIQQSKELQTLLQNEEKTYAELNRAEKKNFLDAIINRKDSSQAVKDFLRQNYNSLV